jgi:hypothetical protein
MKSSNGSQGLGERIEEMVREHVAAARREAQAAVERAFGGPGRQSAVAPRRERAGVQRRRASAELTALGERFYEAVCGKPGETMAVLGAEVGATARELHRSVALLKRSGRVRAVGERSHTRYFPMANGSAASR